MEDIAMFKVGERYYARPITMLGYEYLPKRQEIYNLLAFIEGLPPEVLITIVGHNHGCTCN